jgi:hypothetical protein
MPNYDNVAFPVNIVADVHLPFDCKTVPIPILALRMQLHNLIRYK